MDTGSARSTPRQRKGQAILAGHKSHIVIFGHISYRFSMACKPCGAVSLWPFVFWPYRLPCGIWLFYGIMAFAVSLFCPLHFFVVGLVPRYLARFRYFMLVECSSRQCHLSPGLSPSFRSFFISRVPSYPVPFLLFFSLYLLLSVSVSIF